MNQIFLDIIFCIYLDRKASVEKVNQREAGKFSLSLYDEITKLFAVRCACKMIPRDSK